MRRLQKKCRLRVGLFISAGVVFLYSFFVIGSMTVESMPLGRSHFDVTRDVGGGLFLDVAPDTPHTPDPADGATGIPLLNVVLGWVSDDGDGDSLTYDLYFGNETNPDLYASNLTDDSYTIPEVLDYGTEYYWLINATDSTGNWTMGPQWTFETIHNTPPDTPATVER